MNIKVEYSKEEVDRIVLEHHAKTFDFPPAGYEWGIRESCGDRTVENLLLPDPVEVAPPPSFD